MENEKITVLIADDEDPLRTTIAAWLTDEGFDVDEASSGIEAIAKIQAKDFDIAMLDIKMPGVNGLEVLRYIKKNSSLTEVVMMTGMSDISMAVEAMKLGAKEYLTKPIDMEQLVPQLRAIIQKRNAEDRIRRLQAEHTSRLLYDLHTPIAGLKQSIGYLLKEMAGPLTDHQRELLEYMTSSIDKVIAILNDMMDLTKLEGGRVRLNKGIGSLPMTVQNVCHEYQVPMQSKSITFDFYADTELPALDYDAEKISQVLHTILSNAIAHTPERGAIVVQVQRAALVLEEGQKPQDHVVVSIFNTGKGIPRDEIPYIFERYREILTGKTSESKRSGLGLIIAQRIIEAHNGKIWVESEPGKSVTFYFALPIR
ncbi:MAG: response regulator [Bacteroidetes bacterium]|nr:response regulator [Bacteroidota bacterium]